MVGMPVIVGRSNVCLGVVLERAPNAYFKVRLNEIESWRMCGLPRRNVMRFVPWIGKRGMGNHVRVRIARLDLVGRLQSSLDDNLL